MDEDVHAKYLFSYIHLNPIKLIYSGWKESGIKDKNKALKFLDNYQCSSYQDFCGVIRSENKIISIKDFPDYFSNNMSFKQEIFDWISFTPNLPQSKALGMR